ncbi:MAG: hypothetical protein WBC20_07135 [Candidatus Aminicenantaceae bacterium]
MKIVSIIGVLLVLMFVFSSCIPGPNKLEKTPNKEGKIAGFLKGLWHGFIAPITFIISIFKKSVRFYEVHNNGFWYNFGFVLGAGLFLNGGIFGTRRARRKKKQKESKMNKA